MATDAAISEIEAIAALLKEEEEVAFSVEAAVARERVSAEGFRGSAAGQDRTRRVGGAGK